jgi:hypothetical protein
LRDRRRAATAPRRAYVVVLHDVNPRAIRPLLGVWSSRPAAGRRLSKADRVFRCDDELDELVSLPGRVRVHEAWVDTGPRPSSKLRWVAADDGIAVVHRRALFGRWYLSRLTRRDRGYAKAIDHRPRGAADATETRAGTPRGMSSGPGGVPVHPPGAHRPPARLVDDLNGGLGPGTARQAAASRDSPSAGACRVKCASRAPNTPTAGKGDRRGANGGSRWRRRLGRRCGHRCVRPGHRGRARSPRPRAGR